jgi:TolA-binding protein
MRARALLAALCPLLAVALLCPAALAQQKDPDKKPPAANKTEKPRSDKQSSDSDKARAEVMKLEEQMPALHRQMRETEERLFKAHARLMEQEGFTDEIAFPRFHEGFGMGTRPWHLWHRMMRAEMRHEGKGKGGLEQKVDRLQREVEQLRHDLQQQKK